jgi:Rieske Fe-S protein
MSGMPDPTVLRPSPLAVPIGRRRALVVIGSSVAGLVLVEGCGSSATTPAPRGWVAADVDPAMLEVDKPVPVRFSGTVGGSAVAGSAWLVKHSSGDLVAFDPRCTHAQCAYDATDDGRFACLCHEAFFDLEGTVLSGPPPRALDRFGVRETDGRIELEVPADFSTPRPEDA